MPLGRQRECHGDLYRSLRSLADYVRNLGEAAYHAGAGVHAFAPPLTYASIAPPRAMGIRRRLGFGE